MWLDECDGEVELDLPHGQPPLERLDEWPLWLDEWLEVWWPLPVECDGELELDLPHGQPPLEWVEWVELWWSLPVE